jgi:hypothetical protein
MKKKIVRNAFVTSMKGRKGGRMRSRKSKRKNGRNKKQDYLDGNY